MKSLIHKLDWDSDFFNQKIGEIILDNDVEINDVLDFDLIVIKQKQDYKLSILAYQETFQEVKITFSKIISQNSLIFENSVLDSDMKPINEKDLFSLAYESGKHSRFLLDTHFEHEDFKRLYEQWIINSLNKKFADKVFYLKKDDNISGFVTIKKHNSTTASIGLVAISENMQGMGFGSVLLQMAEDYCVKENIKELRIPTQKTNLQACKFYSKMGYEIIENLTIKHFWKTT
jgi:dTDP-4-amino-4,6-dideoxy-D-galactose acyltransferase